MIPLKGILTDDGNVSTLTSKLKGQGHYENPRNKVVLDIYRVESKIALSRVVNPFDHFHNMMKEVCESLEWPSSRP